MLHQNTAWRGYGMETSLATVEQNCLIDLHLHLDGSISVPMARRLTALDGRTLDEDDAALGRRLSVTADCRDLNEYLAKFDFTAELLETREQLSECAYLLQEELAQLGYVYAEIRFAPQRHGARGLSQREAVEAVLEGLGRSSFEARIILCCMRGDDTLEANLETVRLAAEYLGRGVVALDLAGAEALFPTADYADVFALARKLGVPFTIHAGEADGPQSVWDALSFGAQRIGHGIRAIEDDALVERLAREGIALEMCPTSELQTSAIDDYAKFPLAGLIERGVVVTVNSDNMGVSGTDVRRELLLLTSLFGLTDKDVHQLLANAARSAFASDALKEELVRRIDAEFAR